MMKMITRGKYQITIWDYVLWIYSYHHDGDDGDDDDDDDSGKRTVIAMLGVDSPLLLCAARTWNRIDVDQDDDDGDGDGGDDGDDGNGNLFS